MNIITFLVTSPRKKLLDYAEKKLLVVPHLMQVWPNPAEYDGEADGHDEHGGVHHIVGALASLPFFWSFQKLRCVDFWHIISEKEQAKDDCIKNAIS